MDWRWASCAAGPAASSTPSSCRPISKGLEDVEGVIEDREGHLAVLELALLHLTPLWQGLGVLDEAGRFTGRGVWGLPKALYRIWSGTP